MRFTREMNRTSKSLLIDLVNIYSCVRRSRTQPLICVGCFVHYWVPCAINKEGFFEIAFVRRRRHTFASLWSACLRFASLWRANSCGDSCVLDVHLWNVCWKLTPWVKFYFGLNLHIFLRKMRATPGSIQVEARQLVHGLGQWVNVFLIREL